MDLMLTDLFGELEDDDEDNEDDNEDPLDDMMDVLVDEIILGLCFEVHRSCKMGTFMLDDTDMESQKQYEIKEGRGIDVFGQVPMKKQYDCVCPNCQRSLAASRFAPHLEKCMGMGRNSSRIASRRIANTGQKENDGNESDYNEDSEWNITPEKKVKKMKKEKSSKKTKLFKNKSGDIPSVGSTTSDGSGSQPFYETITFDERKTLLQQTCGVISEHTKKMCTRSSRCPQHTEEQRRAVRIFLLSQQGSVLDDDVIDIDTYDDAESRALRDTLQWEAASNPSPTDSTSTTNSSSSRKRKLSKHSKSKKSAKSSGSHSNTPTKSYEFV